MRKDICLKLRRLFSNSLLATEALQAGLRVLMSLFGGKMVSLENFWLSLFLTSLDLITTWVLLDCTLRFLLLFNKVLRGNFEGDNGFRSLKPPESRWRQKSHTA